MNIFIFFKLNLSKPLCKFLALFCGLWLISGCASLPKNTGVQVKTLLQSGVSVLGEEFAYPDTNKAQVTVSIVTLPPDTRTVLHVHDVPLIAYILEGELVVDYGAKGQKTYRKGEAFVEAFRSGHFGQNNQAEPVRILAVYAGAEGIPNSRNLEDPDTGQTGSQVEILLQSGVTLNGEPLAYPNESKAQVTVSVVTLPPGVQLPLHVHDAPLIAYILEGEIVVDYGEGPEIFRKGDVAIEVLHTSHFGRNDGTEPVRLLAVFTGAEGVSNRKSVQLKPGTKVH